MAFQFIKQILLSSNKNMQFSTFFVFLVADIAYFENLGYKENFMITLLPERKYVFSKKS